MPGHVIVLYQLLELVVGHTKSTDDGLSGEILDALLLE